MNVSKNYLLLFLLFIYTLTGIYLSLTSGISHDEYHEQLNWEINSKAVKSFFLNGNIQELLDYKDKYHGIGFHFISQPIQILINDFVSSYNEVSIYGALLISKHSVIFFLFSISGIFFYLLCLRISKNSFFSFLSTSLYLLYPYLFGHAQINPKDIPFLSIWIIATYFFLITLEDLYFEKKINKKIIITIAFFVAYLISIRISGIIIFIEFIVGLAVLFNIKKINFYIFIKQNYLNFFIYLIALLFFIYILNPIFWTNPLEIINSILWMGKYYNDVCTITLGKCLKSLNLPSSYYFIWFFFKLPILVIFGLALFPFIEKKFLKKKLFHYITVLFYLHS